MRNAWSSYSHACFCYRDMAARPVALAYLLVVIISAACQGVNPSSTLYVFADSNMAVYDSRAKADQLKNSAYYVVSSTCTRSATVASSPRGLLLCNRALPDRTREAGNPKPTDLQARIPSLPEQSIHSSRVNPQGQNKAPQVWRISPVYSKQVAKGQFPDQSRVGVTVLSCPRARKRMRH